MISSEDFPVMLLNDLDDAFSVIESLYGEAALDLGQSATPLIELIGITVEYVEDFIVNDCMTAHGMPFCRFIPTW